MKTIRLENQIQVTCPVCKVNVIGNEFNYLLHCRAYHGLSFYEAKALLGIFKLKEVRK